MLLCMRTTLNLNDELMRRAKEYAARTHRTTTSVVEEALRDLLYERGARARREPVRLPTFNGDGLRPGVDLDSSSELLDVMDDGDGAV